MDLTAFLLEVAKQGVGSAVACAAIAALVYVVLKQMKPEATRTIHEATSKIAQSNTDAATIIANQSRRDRRLMKRCFAQLSQEIERNHEECLKLQIEERRVAERRHEALMNRLAAEVDRRPFPGRNQS